MKFTITLRAEGDDIAAVLAAVHATANRRERFSIHAVDIELDDPIPDAMHYRPLVPTIEDVRYTATQGFDAAERVAIDLVNRTVVPSAERFVEHLGVIRLFTAHPIAAGEECYIRAEDAHIVGTNPF